ncbi:MAG: glycosyltransferase family 4 protein [Thaumarchaeota archaeon]|nr:glycosyltransferase family 4 protein [Nitrososphaerota archaeon]
MRIAIVAPLEIRVPPIAYGGTELVVGTLTEALVRLGHDVTLFASGDSRTRGKLVSIVPEFLRKSERSSPILSFVNIVSCLEKSDDFDIIHNHTNFEGLATAGLVNTPMLTTFHGHLTEELIQLFMRYAGWYNTVSKSAKSLLPPKDRFAGVVYNAIDTAAYPFNSKERSGFLLYLSRFSQEKGPHLAIKIARRLNMPLVMAGNLHPNDQKFFNSEILPYVDGKMIRCEGEVDDERKKELMMEAKCLLAPITWPEPFGLFMIEAMACGTPVIAMDRGSAREVVRDGETGYVVGSLDEMARAIKQIDKIDPWNCRRHVVKNFDCPILVNNYLRAYRRVISESNKIRPELVAIAQV